jgi:hypothetical protein
MTNKNKLGKSLITPCHKIVGRLIHKLEAEHIRITDDNIEYAMNSFEARIDRATHGDGTLGRWSLTLAK